MADDDSLIKVGVNVDTGKLESLGASADKIGKTFNDVTTQALGASASFETLEKQVARTEHSSLEARESILLMGEAIGTRIPRAVATLLSEIAPLGALLELSFPAIAAFALYEAIGRLIEKHEKLLEITSQNAAATAELTIKEKERTDGLDLTNLKLEDAIGKFEGRPNVNKLAEALLEARKAGDELFTSLSEGLNKTGAALEKQTSGWENFKSYAVAFFKDIGTQATITTPALVDTQEKIQHSLAGVAEVTKQVTAAREKYAQAGGEKEQLADIDQIIAANDRLHKTQIDALAALDEKKNAGHSLFTEEAEDEGKLMDGLVTTNAARADAVDLKKQLQLKVQQSGEDPEAEAKAAKIAKEAYDERLASIQTYIQGQKVLFEEGRIDQATWLAEEIQGKQAATGANLEYLGQLVSIYQKAGDAEKLLTAQSQLKVAQDKAETDAEKELGDALEKHRQNLIKVEGEYDKIIQNSVEKEWQKQKQAAVELQGATDSLSDADEKYNKAKKSEEVYGPELNAIELKLAAQKQSNLLGLGEIEAARAQAAIAKEQYEDEQQRSSLAITNEEKLVALKKQAVADAQTRPGGSQADVDAATAAAEKEEAKLKELQAKQLDDQKAYNDKVVSEKIALNQKLAQLDQKYFGEFNRDLGTLVQDWAEGHKKMGQVVENMLAQGLVDLGKYVVQWIAKRVEMYLLEKILGITAAKSSGAETITADAAVAGAGAYAATAIIPYIGPELAPAAAAAAYADTLGFLGALSFDTGGIVPHTGIHQLHAKEGVLTEEQTGWLRGAAGKGIDSGSKKASGDVHFHFAPIINGAFDPQKHGPQVFSYMKSRLMQLGMV